MLEAVNVSKCFGGKTVIQDFSVQLLPGGHYCLMGPSGCGKTTLLNILMGLLKPDSGKVSMPSASKISAVFQEDRLLEHLTAVANVALVSHASRKEIECLLCDLGIAKESLYQPVHTYSGGMQRRVALCRALLADFDTLFLDEPYKGLDADTKSRVKNIVAQYTQGKTVVLVTHEAEDMQGYEGIVCFSVDTHDEL